VAITLLLVNEELPRLTAEPERALLERCVGLMNTYLTSLGMASNDPLIGGLALADLATPVDFVFELHGPLGVSARVKDKLGIHLWDERVLALPRDPEKLTAAAELFRAGREGCEPAYPVYALRQEAIREVLAGRRDYAIVLATIAIEALVDLALTRTWSAFGLPAAELAGALEEPFVRRLRAVRDRLFPGTPEVATAMQEWLDECYEVRKRVIHSGYQPWYSECDRALHATMNLIAAVGAAIEADPRSRGLAGQLPTARRPNSRYAGVRWSGP
jgi:hypothetical protein